MSDEEAPPAVTWDTVLTRLIDLVVDRDGAHDDDQKAWWIIHRLLDVITWEAKKYNGNEPLFATKLPDGRPLSEGIRRQETWRAIFGEPRKEAPPGAWVQCGECRRWHVVHPDSNRSINDDDAAFIAEALEHRRAQE